LKKTNVFLNTSENETFGMVFPEAMAYGLVPIAHMSGAPAEYLPKEFLYSTNHEAREKIIKAIKNYNKDIFESMRNEAKKYLISETEKNILNAFEDAFKD
jgi:glycosyltransferase involved in cell wall biosynthesis